MPLHIKITGCSNSILWYNSHIGKIFEVQRTEDNAYWVLEPDLSYRCINWVYKKDCELV